MKKKRRNRRNGKPVEGQKDNFPAGGMAGRSPGRGRNKGTQPGLGLDKPPTGYALGWFRRKPRNPEPPKEGEE